MESFTRVFPLDWAALRSVLLVAAILVAVCLSLAVVLWQLRSRREKQKKFVAEKIALQFAGDMMTRSRGDGDRFALKESNDIKTLVAESVLALAAQDPRIAGRAIDRLDSGKAAPSADIFAGIARAKAPRRSKPRARPRRPSAVKECSRWRATVKRRSTSSVRLSRSIPPPSTTCSRSRLRISDRTTWRASRACDRRRRKEGTGRITTSPA